MKKTNVITVEEFNRKSGHNFELPKSEFKGIIPGLVCGFCVEAEKDGKIDCGSTIFTNNFEYIKNPEYDPKWNELGICEDLLNLNGWNATGNIVFRGYFVERYDPEERDYCYEEA